VILELDDIVKRFGGLLAINRVSAAVQQGEILGLIGPNGAGKTTLLNVIAGVYRPTSGTVRFLGEDITAHTPEQSCQIGIARTFQIPQPFPYLSAFDNVRMAAVFGNRPPVARPRIWTNEVLDLVEFPMPKDTTARNLNTAHLKRLDLARALASRPRLLLLDEMASGLTPAELMEAMGLIRRIRDTGITIIVVEHVVKMIMEICDRIVVLHHGEKIADGTPNVIATDPNVAEAYLGRKYGEKTHA
jgi:branched-chain amino acid transport system ATP-binding protein